VTDHPGRQLWVLRHAKAASHREDDHERPLTGRGRRQCAELAAHLAESGGVEALPRLVLSSSAVRARQTAELVLGALGDEADLRVEPSLYRADPEGILEDLRLVDDGLPSVMVVAHNPTLEELVWLLVEGDDDGRRQLHHGLSTCALAVVGLELSSWKSLRPGGGRLLSLYSPVAR
jgi:phosphohistidine phosphatase